MFKQLISIWHEKYQTHKALRLLSKQEWSIEFLTAMLIRASKVSNTPLEMSIHNGNKSIVVRTADSVSKYKDDSIFDHLDNELRVSEFIKAVNQ